MKKALLAFSGGLDTSAILVWLQKELNYEVYCYCCDLGNQPDEQWLRDKALSLGAKEFIFEDVKEEFCKEFAFKVIRNGALYEGEYLLGTAIGRPLIAQKMGKVAEKYGIETFVHGATGKGNDQLRLEQSWAFLYPEKEVLTPWKTWEFKGRSDLLQYLEEQGFPYKGESGGKYSIDENLFHKSTEGCELEAVDQEYNAHDVLGESKSLAPIKIVLEYSEGMISKINGQDYTADKAIEFLNDLGNDYQVGIVDIVEERVNGIKSRGIYQTPGGTILYFGLKKLKEINWSHKTTKLAQMMGIEYAELVYDGSWFSFAREAVDGFFEKAAKCLTGKVTLEIGKGFIKVLGRESEFSLYSQKLVSFEEDEFGINQSAVGFCQTRNLIFKNEGRVQ